MPNAESSLTIRVGTIGILGAMNNIRALGKSIGQLPANLQAFNHVAGILGTQIAPQLTNSLQGVAGAFKSLVTSSKLGIGSVLPLAAGATAIFYGWKKAIDEVRESLDQIADEERLKKAFKTTAADLEGQINFLAGRGRIKAGDAVGYINMLRNANTPERQAEVVNQIKEAIATVQTATKAQQEDAAKAQVEFQEFLKANRSLLLDGVAKEKAELTKAMDELVAKGTDIAVRAGVSSQPVLDIANEALQKQLGEVDAKAAREKLEAQQRITQEIRERERKADEFYKREWEHAQQMLEAERQRKIQSIQQNQFLTDAERYTQLKDMGVPQEELGADPTSFTQQFSAQMLQLQNEIGTFSQSSAAMLASGLGAGLNGIGDSIMGVITRSKDMGQIWIGVTRQMLASAIQFSINQLAAFTISKAKELLLHTSTEGVKTAATLSGSTARSAAALNEASAEAVSTGAKAAGSVADIPYVGWALAIAAFGGIVAMIASASASAREFGGPVTAGRSYIVGEKRPELFVPNQNGYILPNVPDNFHAGAGQSSAPVINIPKPQVEIHYVDLPSRVREIIESKMASDVIVKHINSRRGDLGLQT